MTPIERYDLYGDPQTWSENILSSPHGRWVKWVDIVQYIPEEHENTTRFQEVLLMQDSPTDAGDRGALVNIPMPHTGGPHHDPASCPICLGNQVRNIPTEGDEDGKSERTILHGPGTPVVAATVDDVAEVLGALAVAPYRGSHKPDDSPADELVQCSVCKCWVPELPCDCLSDCRTRPLGPTCGCPEPVSAHLCDRPSTGSTQCYDDEAESGSFGVRDRAGNTSRDNG